jgi:NADH-quinone oxidoreductase subunit G
MIELEIDGKKVSVPEGSVVMHAANALDIYVPHFCYHKKLSIAANCRMCLVDIEKAPKPMPACATPVSNGMKVFTKSDKAIKAQKGVMEFLLINHPLDCPICDQGGECQLQDLAVGYGGSASQYTEEKRVVFHKSIGPLVSAEEMSRCIQCTRCVRFGQEIGGVMELGMTGRGEHSEIMSFVGRSVDSELSGNMIDICPVGALTSKPFRYSARTWELSRRQSIAPHDSLGSNLQVQIKSNKVLRVLPLENDAINECWISDKDRFSYEGLNSQERLTQPMIKQDGRWQTVDWQSALQYAAHALRHVKDESGPEALAALGSAHSTVEELYLLQKLMRTMGSDNVDARLRQSDFASDTALVSAPSLGMTIEQFAALDRYLFVGSFLRKDHALMAAKVRQAVKRGANVSIVHGADDDLLMPVANKMILKPSAWATYLSEVIAAVLSSLQKPLPADLALVSISVAAKSCAASLLSGKKIGLFLGNAAVQASDACLLQSKIQDLAAALSQKPLQGEEQYSVGFGQLGEAANSVGLYLVGATPLAKAALAAKPIGVKGMNAAAISVSSAKAFVLLNLEPGSDVAHPNALKVSLKQAKSVIALTSFHSAELAEHADCLLPIAPFTETAGSFINSEGRLQSFNGVVTPAGESRPAWKVLRVIANMLELPGFEFDAAEAVRREALGTALGSGEFVNAKHLGLKLDPSFIKASNEVVSSVASQDGHHRLERLAEVGLYAADPIVRRAPSLQQTADAKHHLAEVHPDTLTSLGVASGAWVDLESEQGAKARVQLNSNDKVAAGTLRLPINTLTSTALPLTGVLQVAGRA